MQKRVCECVLRVVSRAGVPEDNSAINILTRKYNSIGWAKAYSPPAVFYC